MVIAIDTPMGEADFNDLSETVLYVRAVDLDEENIEEMEEEIEQCRARNSRREGTIEDNEIKI